MTIVIGIINTEHRDCEIEVKVGTPDGYDDITRARLKGGETGHFQVRYNQEINIREVKG